MRLASLLHPLAALALAASACDTESKPPPVQDEQPKPPPAPETDAKAPPANAPITDGAPPTAPTGTDEELLASAKGFARANNELAARLYGELASSPGNLALSPASIELALAMTVGGAREQTRSEMLSVMGVSADADVNALARAAMHSWSGAAASSRAPGAEGEAKPGVELQVANRLFGEATFSFVPDFITSTREFYGAPLEPVDFVSNAERERVRINGWVAERTRDKIKDLLPPASVDKLTTLVLVNTIYFNGQWSDPFPPAATADADFMVDGAPVKVPTMKATAAYRSARVDDVEVVELSYVGRRFAMTIAMPTGDLGAFESKLTAARWDQLVAPLQHERLALSLPRFKVDPAQTLSLKDTLTKLGMPTAFAADKADFTAMGVPPEPNDRLYISNVFHKAFVDVNEAGTEAAAATAVVMGRSGGRPAEPRALKIDRPFVFVIRDLDTGAALFIGRVKDPRA